MRLVAVGRRRYALVVTLVAAAVALAGPGPPVGAAPGDPPATDDEGGTAALRVELDAASRGYLDAVAALDRSRRRQQELTVQLAVLEKELAARVATVEEVASVAYRTGRLGALSALLGADSPDGLLDRALALNVVAGNENTAVRQLVQTRGQVAEAKTAIDTEVRQQQRQLAAMAQRKQQAEAALATAERQARERAARERQAREEQAREERAAGGGAPVGPAPQAKPAPRNADGSWPAESCRLDDPTTGGCLTPRTLHALNQARAAGFSRYTACFRSSGSGEHPRGRACDFAAQQGGFGGPATGADRTYGNNLAGFFVANADRLGVLYVIWYRQIWLPSSGWRSYSGGGSASAEHTNHVHLSVY